MKRFRFSWFIVGGIALVVLMGLFFDVWRTYAIKKRLEYDIRQIVKEAAAYLPLRPNEAFEAAKQGLRKRDLNPDPSFITVTGDGKSIEIDYRAQMTAYFAWIVGSPKLPFGAKSRADVTLEGGGPAASLPVSEISFALRKKDFAAGQNILIWPASGMELPEFAPRAYRLDVSGDVKVGDTIPVVAIPTLEEFSSNDEKLVVILDGGALEEGRGVVEGFAALQILGLDAEKRLTGRFIRRSVSGEPARQLSQEHDFGVLQGGTPKVNLK